MTKKVLAAILARGGSKGIPGKNLVPLAGKPLITWTVEAAMGAHCIDDVVVSSDSEEILEVSKYSGAEGILRPKELATNDASSNDALAHLIKRLKEMGRDYHYVMLLQPTSPLRTAGDIDAAFEKMHQSGAQALISVVAPKQSPLKAFKVQKDGFLEGIINNAYPFMARQKLPKTYYANGAIYIVEPDRFQKSRSFLAEKTVPFEMDCDRSIDIDTVDDLKEAERLLS